MSDRIVLRKVFAVDSNTGLTMPEGNVLLTNNLGGTTWTPILSTLVIIGGPIVGNLPSTISSFSTITYTNTADISTISTTYLAAICSLGAIINQQSGTVYTDGLGSVGYVSTATMNAAFSTFAASPSTVSTMAASLSSLGFVNLSSMSSFAYSQSQSSMSTVAALGSLGYVSSFSLISTVEGLGSSGYISTINTPMTFQSTVSGLGSAGYVSTQTLTKTVNSLGSVGYISSLSLTSTIDGLGQRGYVSTGDLVSTTMSLSSMKANIRFDNVNTIQIIGGCNINTFTSIGNLIFVSTFFQSSIAYSGARSGTQIQGRVINFVDMEFSTARIHLDAFSSFINENSRVTIEVYPTLAFTKLATSANNVAILPISTLLKYDTNPLLNTVATNFLYVGNTKTVLENGNPSPDCSNIYNQPIRLTIPQGTIHSLVSGGRYDKPYTLYHYMPSSINQTNFVNALHSNYITPYFGSTGSVFVTVQNSV